MPCATAEPTIQGQEAFVPPANFAEFYDRYPQMVNWWLRRRMKCPIEIVQDYEQSLLVHLMGRSKNMAAAGIPDRIATYVQGPDTRSPWGAWVSYICGTLLRNEYIKLVEKEARHGVERRANTISLPTTDEEFRAFQSQKGQGHLDMTPGQVHDFDAAAICPSHGPMVVSSVFWSGFIAYVEDHQPEIVPVLRALEDHDTFTAACNALGLKQSTRRNYWDDLLRLMKNYRRNC